MLTTACFNGRRKGNYEKISQKINQPQHLGGRHTQLKNLQKALPAHLRGSKEAKRATKELLKRRFLNIKISTGEDHVSLNSHKQKEIYEFLEED